MRCGRAQAKLIVAEKRKARQAVITKLRAAKQKIDPKKLPTISLTNSDLPRIVNGRQTDKGKKRPFCYAFGPNTIGKTLDKLGYIDSDGWVTGACINHPKVQPTAAAAADGAPALDSIAGRRAAQRELHERNIEKAKEAGLDTSHFIVETKPVRQKAAPAERDSAAVGPPTDAEAEFLKLKAAGVTPMNVFLYAGTDSMWAPPVIGLVVDSLEEKVANAARVAADKDASFGKLHEEVRLAFL